MGNIFGKQGAPSQAANHGSKKITAQDRAILDLKVQRDKLKQYQKKIQGILDRETEIAKELLKKGDKKRALLCLKKKKYQESMLEKTDAQLMNLEELTQSIEFAAVQAKVMEGLKAGNEVLKEINSQMSIDDVERLMSETAEGIEYQREIDELISGKITEEDEEAILEELSRLQHEEAAQIKLPDVPNTNVPTGSKEADEDSGTATKVGQKASRGEKQMVAA